MKNTPYIRPLRQAQGKKAQFKKGIAPIIIALIVALLAGGGYAVIKTNPGLAKKLGIEKQEEEKEAKKDETAGATTHFVEIKELGLRLSVDDRLKDLVYDFQDFGGGAYRVSFSTDSITQLSKYCAANKTAPFGGLGVYTSDAWNKFVKENQGYYKNDTFTQVGSYKVIHTTPQSVCFDGSDAIVVNLIQKQGKAYNEALKTLEPSISSVSVAPVFSNKKETCPDEQMKWGEKCVPYLAVLSPKADAVIIKGQPFKVTWNSAPELGDAMINIYTETEIGYCKIGSASGFKGVVQITLIDKPGCFIPLGQHQISIEAVNRVTGKIIVNNGTGYSFTVTN